MDIQSELAKSDSCLISQISRSIKEIPKYCHIGIKEWQGIEKREKYK